MTRRLLKNAVLFFAILFLIWIFWLPSSGMYQLFSPHPTDDTIDIGVPKGFQTLSKEAYMNTSAYLWSQSHNIPSASHCTFRATDISIHKKEKMKDCTFFPSTSQLKEGRLEILPNLVVNISVVDRNPWVDPTDPKKHQILPRDWKVISGPKALPMHSEYVEIYSKDGELLGLHVDVVEKPLGDVRKLKMLSRKARGWKFPNIVIFSIDSISRAHFNLALPKTSSFLKDLNLKDTHRSFIFSRLNGMAGQTAANLTPQLSGQFYDQEKLNEERWRTATYYNPLSDWIWNWAKDQGYVTMIGNDMCGEMFGCTKWDKAGIDHIAPVITDDCQYVYQQEHHLGSGTCIAGKLVHEYYQEYTLKFMQKYRETPKFSFVHFGEGHVNQPWAVNILDKSSRTFVEELIKDTNTILIVSSDHGKGAGHRMPLFTLTIPIQYLNQEIERNLFHNQEELISWFDVYRTLKHLMAYPTSMEEVFDNPSKNAPEAQSLLNKVPYTRTCSSIGLAVADCLCTPWVFLKLDQMKPNEFSDILTEHLNQLPGVQGFRECPTLEIDEIMTMEYRVEDVFYQISYKIKGSPLFYRAILLFADESLRVLSTHQTHTNRIYEKCIPKGADREFCICM